MYSESVDLKKATSSHRNVKIIKDSVAGYTPVLTKAVANYIVF